MPRRLSIFLVIPFLIVFLPCNVSAEEKLKDSVSVTQACDRAVCDDICELIKNDIKRGVNTKAVTKTNILLGSNVCFVIKCVIDGGGGLEPLIAGAVEAGATPDVISRCTGAGSGSAGAASSPGEQAPFDVQPPSVAPPSTPPGGTISPYSF